MAVSPVGSYHSAFSTKRASGAQSDTAVVIPAGATIAIISIARWRGASGSFPVDSVTLDGQAATLIDEFVTGNSANEVDQWWVRGFSAGSGKTLSWTNPSTFQDGMIIGIEFFSGEDSATPIGAHDNAFDNNSGGTASTTSLAASAGDMFVCSAAGDKTLTLSYGTGQISDFLAGPASGSDFCTLGMTHEAATGAGSQSAIGDFVSAVACVIKAAAGGASFTLTADQGSYSLSGESVGLRAARNLVAAHGSYSLSGEAVALRVGRSTVAAQGSYALNGQPAVLRAARRLLAAQGSYALNGEDVTLAPSSSPTLAAAPGVYALTGNVAALRADRRLAAAQGSYALTGESVALRAARALAAATGAYALSGQTVFLRAPPKLSAAAGVYFLTGYDAVLLYSAAAEPAMADPTSRLPSESSTGEVARPRNWEPFDLSYFRWKYARERERVERLDLNAHAVKAFRARSEEAAADVDEDIAELEAELERFERANGRQRKYIGDVETAIARVREVLELARAARRRRQEELAVVLILIRSLGASR